MLYIQLMNFEPNGRYWVVDDRLPIIDSSSFRAFVKIKIKKIHRLLKLI